MAYTAAVLDSQIDVSDIRDLLVQGDTAFPTINFTLPAGFTGLTWRVRGTFMQFNLATQSEELAVTGSTTISIAWPVGSNFTTYYGEMQIVLVGTDALGNIVTKATGYVNVHRDYSISTVEIVDENLFEQLMAELSSSSVMLDQATEQEIVKGVPKLAADRVISDDHHIVDKKHVADAVAAVTADDFNHNDLANKQGGAEDEYYHVTAAEKTIIENTSGMNTGDQVLPTRDSLGLDTDDTVTFANLSGTNTGDQDVSGAISTHNTDAGAHAGLARKSEIMRLLFSRTIQAEENASALEYTQDDDENPINLKEIILRAYVPSNGLGSGAAASIFFRVNSYAGAADYTRSGSFASALYLATFGSSFGSGEARLCKVGRHFNGQYGYVRYDGTNMAPAMAFHTVVPLIDAIQSLYVFVTGMTFFPVGTVIQGWGIDA